MSIIIYVYFSQNQPYLDVQVLVLVLPCLKLQWDHCLYEFSPYIKKSGETCLSSSCCFEIVRPTLSYMNLQEFGTPGLMMIDHDGCDDGGSKCDVDRVVGMLVLKVVEVVIVMRMTFNQNKRELN